MSDFFSLHERVTIPVNVYSTYYTVPASPKGMICNGIFDILPVINSLKLVIFNHRGVYQDSVRYYKYIDGEFVFPINTLHILKKVFEETKSVDSNFDYEITQHLPNKTTSVPSFKMRPEWTDRPEHAAAIEHLLDDSRSLRGNDLQTGKGKTYVGIKVSTILKHPTLVICESLMEQWVENYLEKTMISDKEICVIQGIDSIAELWNKIKKKQQLPVVVIGSLKTIAFYSTYEDPSYRQYPPFNELLKKLKIGYVIQDEIHLSTHAHVLIELSMNVKHTVVLSATPKRASPREQTIFLKIFPKGTIAGTNEYDRYVNSKILFYHINPHCKSDRFNSYGYGYSHIRYESFVLSNKKLLDEYIKYILRVLQAEYINRAKPEDKCVIFVSTVRMTEYLKLELNKELRISGYDIRTYVQKDPIDNLSDADIIITTPKSCGVGKDISGLITVINTVSLSSEPLLEQMFGRLRKLQDKECRYIDIINQSVDQHMRHLKTKKSVYNRCSNSLTIGEA